MTRRRALVLALLCACGDDGYGTLDDGSSGADTVPTTASTTGDAGSSTSPSTSTDPDETTDAPTDTSTTGDASTTGDTSTTVDTSTTDDTSTSTTDDASDTDASTSTTTGDAQVGYGDCFPDDSTCLPTEVCEVAELIGPDHSSACTQPGCVTADDCPDAPPGGNPTISCADATGDGVLDCYLSCESGESCPTGMICALGFVCTHPSPWTCEFGAYGGGDGCDCGCGLVDPDCADASVDACDSCNAPGSCDTTDSGCPGAIEPTDNAACDPLAIWTCADAAYADGVSCDCGCGLLDPDCADASEAACDACNGAGSCAEALIGCSAIADMNNAFCVPPEWTCFDGWFGDGECDCGCGVVDVDCPTASVDACLYCNLAGSCGEGGPLCPGNIDPDDNSQCV